MPSLRGLKLATYLLFAPSGTGIVAYQLSDKYKTLMNFDEVFFLVKATQDLYDSGIPKVPKEVESAVEEILKHKDKVIAQIKQRRTKKRARRSVSPKESVSVQVSNGSEITKDEPEIFNNGKKNYWCRYFDYSGGKNNVIMQYDPFCTLYNIFDHKGDQAVEQVSDDRITIAYPKNLTINISDLNIRTSSLESKKLKKNDEFKKGGFYLLKLDKNRIPQVNSSFNIELTATGESNRHSERIYQRKITTLKIQAPLNGNPEEQINFQYSDLPSSRLIVKKVEGGNVQISSKPEETSEQSEEVASYYFKNNDNDSDSLYVEEAWSFGKHSKTTASSSDKDKFDLSLIDEEPLSGFGSQSKEKKLEDQTNEEKYYLFKNVSDFWRYKVGDKIDLYKSTSKEVRRRKRELQEQPETSILVEKKLATFEIVSGAIYHSSVSPRCVTKEQKSQQEIKPNLRKRYPLIDIATDQKEFCRYQKGIPEHVLFLIGYNENTNKAI